MFAQALNIMRDVSAQIIFMFPLLIKQENYRASYQKIQWGQLPMPPDLTIKKWETSYF